MLALSKIRNDQQVLFVLSSATGRATSVTSSRANGRALPKPGSVASAVGGMDRIDPNNECSQTATSSESASERDGKESSTSSTRRYTASEIGGRRRDPSSWSTFSAELSSNGKPLESGDDTSRRSLGPGAAANFGYSGTPLRFFPGWQGPINSTHAYSPNPRVDKGPATYNLTQSSPGTLFYTPTLTMPKSIIVSPFFLNLQVAHI